MLTFYRCFERYDAEPSVSNLLMVNEISKLTDAKNTYSIEQRKRQPVFKLFYSNHLRGASPELRRIALPHEIGLLSSFLW
jgi:hypothetical protein